MHEAWGVGDQWADPGPTGAITSPSRHCEHFGIPLGNLEHVWAAHFALLPSQP